MESEKKLCVWSGVWGEEVPLTGLSAGSSSVDLSRVGRNRECWVSIMWTIGSWVSCEHAGLSGRYNSCVAAWRASKNARSWYRNLGGKNQRGNGIRNNKKTFFSLSILLRRSPLRPKVRILERTVIHHHPDNLSRTKPARVTRSASETRAGRSSLPFLTVQMPSELPA